MDTPTESEQAKAADNILILDSDLLLAKARRSAERWVAVGLKTSQVNEAFVRGFLRGYRETETKQHNNK